MGGYGNRRINCGIYKGIRITIRIGRGSFVSIQQGEKRRGFDWYSLEEGYHQYFLG